MLVIPTTTPSNTLRSFAIAPEVRPSAFQLPVLKTYAKNHAETEVPQIRDAYVWQIGSGPALALSVTSPKATWKKDEYRNYAIMISQYQGKAMFTRLHAAWKAAGVECKHFKVVEAEGQ